MRIALDTNILVYAERFGDAERCERACTLLEVLPAHKVLIPVQCFGELLRVLHGKAGLSRQEAVERVLYWTELYTHMPSTMQALFLALDLVRSHAIQIWDALIIAVASLTQCRLIATEDVPGETSLAGVRIVCPFEESGYKDLLEAASS